MAKKTSSLNRDSVFAGELWAVPLPKLGYYPLVIARTPGKELDFVLAYLKPELSDDPASEIAPPRTWKRAWVGLVSTLSFRKKRWVRCVEVQGFDPVEWPLPPWRSSAVDEDDPIEEWGRHPWGEMWSIETTLDEPTMTLVANEPATREEALRFPSTTVVTAASAFEKSLVHYARERKPSFWDMHFGFQEIEPGMIEHWREYGERIRRTHADSLPDWLPAGRKTDRGLQAGTWLAMPLSGGGFGAAMLIERPEKHLRFFSDSVVMAMRRRWDRWPTLDDVVDLQPEDGAIVAQTSMICVRDGRWRVLGSHPGFDPEAWVWPYPWMEFPRGSGDLSIEVGEGEPISFRIDPIVRSLDPNSGVRCSGCSSYWAFEMNVPLVLNGTFPATAESDFHQDGLVTVERLAAWRAINREVRRALHIE